MTIIERKVFVCPKLLMGPDLVRTYKKENMESRVVITFDDLKFVSKVS